MRERQRQGGKKSKVDGSRDSTASSGIEEIKEVMVAKGQSERRS